VEASDTTSLLGEGEVRATVMFPDGSRRIREFVDGDLTREVREDTSGEIVSEVVLEPDAHGRIHRSTDRRNGTTTWSWNDDGTIDQVTLPAPDAGTEAQVIRYTYDDRGRVETVVLPDGGTVDHDYDFRGNLIHRSGARTPAVDFTYDSQSWLRTQSTAAGLTTWNYFPESGRLQSKVHGDGQGPGFTYTPAGRLESRTNGRGTAITFQYDALADLVSVDPDDATPDVTYAYTRRGDLKTVTRAGRTHRYVYNLAGQLESAQIDGGALAGVVVDPEYDPVLRRASLTVSGPGWSVPSIYDYDAASRLQSVTSHHRQWRYEYAADSDWLESATSFSGNTWVLQASRAWDKLGRLEVLGNQSNGSGGTLSWSEAYEYNPANQRTRRTLGSGEYWEYAYDALGQLTEGRAHTAGGIPLAGRQFSYAYDGAGNRLEDQFGGDVSGTRSRWTPLVALSKRTWLSRRSSTARWRARRGRPMHRPAMRRSSTMRTGI